MRFSEEQNRALQSVQRWLESSDQQVFRLFGYAGTGKTTLAKHLAEGVGNVLFGAYTGKAAHVLQKKGCPARTLHSLAYVPTSRSRSRLLELKKKLEDMDEKDPFYAKTKHEITLEEENAKRPMFTLNLDSDLRETDLLVVDEVSMVNEEMGRDLESFGCKILVLGDPAQLPPVYGAGYFIDAEPDFMLEHIHRQAADNPIIRLATSIRNKEIPHAGQYGESRVIRRQEITSEDVLSVNQVIVGKNKTRQRWNHRIRSLLGRENGGMPVVGDRLVCLKNEHDVGLLNGAIWCVRETMQEVDDDEFVDVDGCDLLLGLEPEDGGQVQQLAVHRHYFQGEKPTLWEMDQATHFDYGYTLTCHKSQGSEWPKVLVFDERMMRGDDYYRWLYTAVTRAGEEVCLVR